MAPETRKLVKKNELHMEKTYFLELLYGDDFENLLMTTFDFVPRHLAVGQWGTDAVINYHANICREH